jgi:hypothetical protein
MLLALLALALPGCWDCDFHARGACVQLAPGMDGWPAVEARVDATIAAAQGYCGGELAGWRIRFVDELDGCGWRPFAAPPIGVVGCTNHLPRWLGGRTVQVEIGGKGERDCLEHSSLVHELCHVAVDGMVTSRFHGSRLEAGMCASGIWQDATSRVPSCSDQVACGF